MKTYCSKWLGRIHKSTTFQIIIFSIVIIVMANLNAQVDYFLHPEIPYFDKEHLIVGGITGFVSIVLFGLLLTYMRHLSNALKSILTLESILPICSNCKKIRQMGSDPMQMDSWQPIESYITQKTATEFSHGICPECLSKQYPDFDNRNIK